MWMHSAAKVAWISILHLRNSSFPNCGNIPWLRFTSSPPLKGREPCHCVRCRQDQRWWGAASGCCSVPKSCPALCNPMDCSTPSFPVLHHLLECVQIQVYRVSDATQPSHPLSPLLLPSIFPSIRVFSSEWNLCIRWPKYRSFSFSITPSSE